MFGLLSALVAASIILVLIGASIAASFGLGAVLIAWLHDISMSATFSTMYSQVSGSALIALPLFIYMGILVERSGQGERLVDFVTVALGNIRGALGLVSVIGCAIFGAVSGSGSAAVAALGTVIIPRAAKAGYPKEYMVAVIACSSVLTLLIPPSIPMLVLALATQISIAGAFLTTVLPGVVITVGYCILNMWFVRRFPIDERASRGQTHMTHRQEFRHYGKRAFWVALMPVFVLGSIYGGVASPTEAAGIGILYVVLLAFFIYRSLGVRSFVRATIDSGEMIGALIFMIGALTLLSIVFLYQGIPFALGEVVSENLAPWQALLLMNVVLLVIGMIMDDISGSIVAASVLYPVALDIGIDPLQFAAIVGVNLGLGNVTPPVAPQLYLASAVAGNIPMNRYVGYVFGFLLLVNLPVLLLVTYWPAFSLALPRAMGF